MGMTRKPEHLLENSPDNKFPGTLEDFKDFWAEGSNAYAYRCGRNSYSVVEKTADESYPYHIWLIECDDDVSDAIIQKLIDKGHLIDSGKWNDNECETCLLQSAKNNELPIVECPSCGKKTFRMSAKVGEQSFSCDTCGESCIATYFPPCMEDNDNYTLELLLDGDISLKTITAIGKIFNEKYTVLYKDYKAAKRIVFWGSLESALTKMQCLDEINITYQLSPEFPYSEIHKCHQQGIV